jgi:hypothetical protein
MFIPHCYQNRCKGNTPENKHFSPSCAGWKNVLTFLNSPGMRDARMGIKGLH